MSIHVLKVVIAIALAALVIAPWFLPSIRLGRRRSGDGGSGLGGESFGDARGDHDSQHHGHGSDHAGLDGGHGGGDGGGGSH